MNVVIDASITLAWLHGDERTPVISEIFDEIVKAGAVVPAIWSLEVANGFTLAIRRGRTTVALRDRAFADLALLAIEVDSETAAQAWKATLKLADLYRLTVYDAAYLELARRRELPLATLDTALADAANKAGVPVMPQ